MVCWQTPRRGLHCWAMVGGFLELEMERRILREIAVCSVAGRTCWSGLSIIQRTTVTDHFRVGLFYLNINKHGQDTFEVER